MSNNQLHADLISFRRQIQKNVVNHLLPPINHWNIVYELIGAADET